MKSLHIVADDHIWGVRMAFGRLPGWDVSLQAVPADAIDAALVRRADVLLVRSSTRVDASLLQGSRVRFVASATIGTDHVDLSWLEEQSIAFASAAGSSTDSVLEYMVSALLYLHRHGHMNLRSDRLGVIGVGRIGSGLLARCRALGVDTWGNDPPRAAICEPGEEWYDLDALLYDCDVLTLHTPLLREGPHATFHLLDSDALARFRGRGVINAARGACVDGAALLHWLDQDPMRWAVLDCWEHEPDIDVRLLRHPGVVLATPHIAGHSLDGKAANTMFVYRALCDFLGLVPCWDPVAMLPPARAPLQPAMDDNDPWLCLQWMTRKDCPIWRDHWLMRTWAVDDDACLGQRFRHFRRHYPVRRGWSLCRWYIPDARLRAMARGVGFSIVQ